MANKLDSFLTVSEAAEHVGVSANIIRNWGREGKIKEHRHSINNYRLFKTIDLDRLLKQANKPTKNARVKTKPR